MIREQMESLASEQRSERKQHATAVEAENQKSRQQKALRDESIKQNREALDKMLEEKLSVKKAEKQRGVLELEEYSKRLEFEERRRKAELQSISARARKMNELQDKVFKVEKVNENRME